MDIMVTGASGFVGSALIPKLTARGDRVYGLSRHPPKRSKSLVPLEGDITEPDLGLERVPSGIAAVYHLAGMHNLGQDKDGLIWKTNVDGTRNILDFCAKHGVKHLYFISTAYTQGRNTYERSKITNEKEVADFCPVHGIAFTIFKPSIIMGTRSNFYPGHFSQFVALVIRLHKRAETVRRKLEGTLRLPVIRPAFRIEGNPEAKLNLVPIDAVAAAMARIGSEGKYLLSNPRPPTLKQLADWVGETIMVDIKFETDFKPTPLESQFAKMGAAFAPYLRGDDFRSDLGECRPRVDKRFIQWTVLNTLKRLTGPGEV